MNFINTEIRTLFFLIVFSDVSYGATRIYFSKCSQKGFTCLTNANKKTEITYECPSGVDDVALFPNQFSAPSTIVSLKIKNCKTLTLSTRCSGENRQIEKLHVVNVNRLIFQRLQYEPMIPPQVIFENISLIDVIPTKTFGQINKAYHTVGCYAQPVDFQSVYFRNVTINTIQSNAFVGLNQFKNFTFYNVNIKRIETAGIQLKHDHNNGFEMKNCVVEAVEYSGIQIYGKLAIFADNHFTEIWSNGINGTFEDFYFTKNVVETLQPHAFSVLATNIFILDNDFLHLKSAALEKLSPGLLQDSGMNFGKLKFMYDFSKNSLNFLDAGSIHPDYVSYENVQTEMMFSRNKFLCSCENLGWLVSSLGHGPNTALLEPFYDMVMDDSYGNVCDKSYGKPCDVPIRMVRQMVGNGKCLANVTLDVLCDRLNPVETTTSNLNVNVSLEQSALELLNYTMIGSGSGVLSGSFRFYIAYVLIVIAIIINHFS